MNTYDRYLQEESLEWLDEWDEACTDGFLEENINDEYIH